MNDHPTTSGRLEELRNKFPGWRITRAEAPHSIGFTADRGDEHIWSPHLTGLAARLAEAHDDGKAAR